MKLAKGMVRSRKTGKIHHKSIKLSTRDKRADRKRKGRHLKPATKLKIARAVKKAIRTGRTEYGRRSLRHRKI